MFKKRIFTFKTLIINISALISGLPSSIRARRQKRISPVFAEKLRLAATSVNKCVYCTYGHTIIGMRAGLTHEEIEHILTGEIDKSIEEHEAPALLFAQHFAETAGYPESRMLYQLYTLYGPLQAKDILAYLREIQFGNLSGNTFEAFLSRLKGNPAPKSNPLFEAMFFIFSLPVLGPVHIMMRRNRKKI